MFRFNRFVDYWRQNARELRSVGQERLDQLNFEPPQFSCTSPLRQLFAIRGEPWTHFYPPALVLKGCTERRLKCFGALTPWWIHSESVYSAIPGLIRGGWLAEVY